MKWWEGNPEDNDCLGPSNVTIYDSLRPEFTIRRPSLGFLLICLALPRTLIKWVSLKLSLIGPTRLTAPG